MVESRKRKIRSLRTVHRPQKKQGKPTATKELVLTLSIPDGEVVKVETLEKSGQRQELSEEAFAELAGEDEGEEISPEEAYAIGITDASEDELEFDETGDEEEIERFILREMVARQLLRRGVRRFILRRLHRRGLIRQQTRSGGKAAHEATHHASHKNGHESG
jgi:hypothetical protein